MISRTLFLNLIRTENFRDLFIGHLGWDNWNRTNQLPPINIDNSSFQIHIIAQRNSFQILHCQVDAIPSQSLAKKLDSKLRRHSEAGYICIYTLRGANAHHLWCVPLRSNEKRDLVMVEYTDAHADVLYSKIEGISFNPDEHTNIVDLRAKVQSAFAVNSEQITRQFYSGFRRQHKAFAQLITGIDDQTPTDNNRNKQWYTSVMLNRLMFCYFIQKKGFLDLNHNYLNQKLRQVQAQQGENQFFQTFYRGFLTQLFHDGLNSPSHNNDFRARYGRIPYLNGGMFDVHQIERQYPNIDIADKAFEQLFQFFDQWNWHLDTRITASGRDINPDVLGYIFEQYINDRAQMGAYYTKEDITEYISRNCILPFIFDKVATASSNVAKQFAPDGYVWQTLRSSHDKYIFDAVKHGLDHFAEIPAQISRGIISTPAMHHEYAEVPVGQHAPNHIPLATLRSEWNRPTPPPWAIPTEIWRETIDRLQRAQHLLNKITNGSITSINDFITYNLDIRSFALDLIAQADSKFVKHFYEALTSVTILDPTCGSGAFLFAAMNILEPLYEACIERMQALNLNNPKYFKEELAEINGKYRSNIQYFIFKSIILRNLYGVDIMVEATEIAKLRLFLKMVAVVDVDPRAQNLGLDPLPDIDFNIRCGNTLVGYATKKQLDYDLEHADDILQDLANQDFKPQIDKEMEIVATTYNTFKNLQLKQDEDLATFKQAKHDLHSRLKTLNSTLNQRLHQASNPNIDYDTWLASHQPFNWIAEFYGIIQGQGGFDVIIGNPPYVEYRNVIQNYQITNYKTLPCGNLYAFVLERSKNIMSRIGYIGMIIPMSGHSTARMTPLCDYVYNAFGLHLHLNLSADANPQRLFEGVKFRLCIFFGNNTYKGSFSSKYLRWNASQRPVLFKGLINFNSINNYTYPGIITKIPDFKIINIFNKIKRESQFFGAYVGNNDVFYHNAPVNWIRSHNWVPYFKSESNGERASTQLKKYSFKTNDLSSIGMNIICSSLFFLWWLNHSDCYHLNNPELQYFGYDPTSDNNTHILLNRKLVSDMKQNSKRRVYVYAHTGRVEYDEFYMKLSKGIIDEIDAELAKHYGFSEEELDFIINYDIKYRMGDELNTEE